jgi:AAA15 family ATPase/GTPase
MHISKIFIKNFKNIEELEIFPNQNFNVIIGENNQGKTTIFEALQTWYRCYQLYIRPNRTHFYKGNNLYLNYENLDFLRLSKDTDLYTSAPNKAIIGLTINDTNLEGVETEFNLEFLINRPQSISNAYLRVIKKVNANFYSFGEHLRNKSTKLDDAIFLYQTNPIARVLRKEPFMNEGQIRKKIKRGNSQEVLRSKILLHKNKEKLEEQVSKVLGTDIKFHLSNKNKKDKDEYVILQVERNNKSFELYLQGSGLIQITEIFATVDYLASKLNILLIDEPDSHIHLTLQKRLMENLKELSDNQTFIISHNDGFVSETKDGELFYLNDNSKNIKKLLPLEDADLIKKDFGSPIQTLEELNSSDNIVFVEGNDDKNYFKTLRNKILDSDIETNIDEMKKCFFFQIRGKDNLVVKIDNNRRTLSQLFNDKKYIIITDKDFSTVTLSNTENTAIQTRLRGNSKAICHDGYCIESTLFSDLEKLNNYITYKTSLSYSDIATNSNEILDSFISDFNNVSSERHSNFEQKFITQQKNRIELSTITFNQVLRDSILNKDSLKNIMNKGLIREYITCLETKCSVEIVENGSVLNDEDFCNKLFTDYLDNIPNHKILFDCHKSFITEIYNITF